MTQSPFDVIKNQYTIDELNDIVEHGCASGCASNHIYYTDTVSFYDQHEDAICEYVRDVTDPSYLTETFSNNEGNLTGYKNDIVWTFIELYAMELIDNINNEEMEITGSYTQSDGVDINDILSSSWGESHIQIVNG